ncbi:hypothetical protein [Sporolactobacillus terrae]|nr:hypothetical protein [Sporolactobacillus terrae]
MEKNNPKLKQKVKNRKFIDHPIKIGDHSFKKAIKEIDKVIDKINNQR